VAREGWLAWVADEDTIYAFDGSAWAASIKLLGINATPDSTNRLAVKSPASLFDNVGNGHQQKINKAAAGDTASTLYQTGYSGRAEYGLTGDDNFHVKVSPDGSSWKAAVVVDRSSGDVAFPQLPPIFILATGQSNFVQAPSMSWTPAPNAYVWNNTVNTDGSVGSAFAVPSATTMNAAERLASEVARANPGRKVYLLNVSFGGQTIAHWKTGASSPDVYANITSNITGALAAAGVSTIDCLAWWQGESDAASPSTYVADFETVMSRFKAETWFPPTTSVIVFGTQDSTVSGGAIPADFNRYQQRTVAAAPDTRTFIYTASLPSALFTGSLHMTAAGYAAVGKLAAEAFIGRHRRPALPNMVVDAETGGVIIGGGAGSKDGWLGIGIAPVNGFIDAYNASGANFFVSSEGVANMVMQRAANNAGLTNFYRPQGARHHRLAGGIQQRRRRDPLQLPGPRRQRLGLGGIPRRLHRRRHLDQQLAGAAAALDLSGGVDRTRRALCHQERRQARLRHDGTDQLRELRGHRRAGDRQQLHAGHGQQALYRRVRGERHGQHLRRAAED
jgi:Carbohydrate esterase, sialic acid-specific acetylesterase